MSAKAEDELIKRLLAEAIQQMGGEFRVSLQDLSAHRGQVRIASDGETIICSLACQQGAA